MLRPYSTLDSTHVPRVKIENIIKKPGVLDPDAPEDAASTRWWANVGGRSSNTEKISIAATSQAAVKSTPGFVSSLMGGQDGAGEQLALTNGTSSKAPAGTAGPSLQDLVSIMNGQNSTVPTAKGKAKAKAKAKAAVAKDVPKNPEEHREAIRKSSSLRLFFSSLLNESPCNNICTWIVNRFL